ncbi:MAG: hypothetical protein PHO70_05640 [Candidatus Omnitrophica bacterium]|nr:hypothetical protein [Candidatus Omnitrophota bacterium]
MDKLDTKNLKKRYLVWFYKTTKEALDKIERKFTQVEIDKIILKDLNKLDKPKLAQKYIDEFKVYIQNKLVEGNNLKFDGARLRPEYYFLVLKLKAIESVIVKEFGKKVLAEIKFLYEIEMTERILKSTEH